MKNSNKERASRGVLRGIGNNTVQGPAGAKGGNEVVHTFGWYLRQMVKDVQAKRAIPLLSGMVPTNSFSSGRFRTNWPMASDTAAVAKQEGVEYIDHTKYTAARFQSLGEGAVKRFFPRDSTHTNSAGARGASRRCDRRLLTCSVNAETFVTALKCARSKAATYVGSKGQALTQRC
jgi:rhamnogalacturonan acetylesterase